MTAVYVRNFAFEDLDGVVHWRSGFTATVEDGERYGWIADCNWTGTGQLGPAMIGNARLGLRPSDVTCLRCLACEESCSSR